MNSLDELTAARIDKARHELHRQAETAEWCAPWVSDDTGEADTVQVDGEVNLRELVEAIMR